MKEPLISVIVPVYKVEKYLERCVDSITNQTYKNLEIILVDDGSPDKSGEMCDELAKKDSRIRVVHKENGGLSSARNAGLDVMTGDYVGFVDSDDWVDLSMYEILYQRMIQANAQISCCGIARHDGTNTLSYFSNNLQENFTLTREEAMAELNRNYRITNSVCDKLYQADLFHDLRMRLGILYEDAQIQPYLIHRAQKITYTAKPMYIYFQSQDSILRGEFSVRHYDCIEVLKERIAFFEEHHPLAVIGAKAEYLELCLHFIYQSRDSVPWKPLRADLIRSVRKIEDKKIIRCLPAKIRLKRAVLCISEKLFIGFMDLYTKRKGK